MWHTLFSVGRAIVKASVLLQRAENYRLKMEKALDPINMALEKLFDDPVTSFTFQPGDGWVVLFGDGLNAKIGFDEIDHLLTMSREEAFDFLESRSI